MPEIPSTAQKSLALWGAAGPGDRRDTRTKVYMPSPPNGVKELNSLSFGKFQSYRIWRGGHWIVEETPAAEQVAARPSLLTTAGVAVEPYWSRQPKKPGPPDGGPVDYDFYRQAPELTSAARVPAGRTSSSPAASRCRGTSARFAGWQRSSSPVAATVLVGA